MSVASLPPHVGTVVVVPVKPAASAKTRLGAVPAPVREDLVVAFARDTVRACLAASGVDGVVVVTEEARLTGLGDAPRCVVVPEGRERGLNAALRHGAAVATSTWPGRRVAALLADVPALRADDLARALAAAESEHAWFVADADGTGTTLYVAPEDRFDPRFGAGSAAAHAGAGARPVQLDVASLRRDVDDLASLRAAAALGVGPATAAVLAARADLVIPTSS